MRTTVAAIAGALLATLGLAVVQTRTSMPVQTPGAMSAAWPGLPGAQPVGLSTAGLATAVQMGAQPLAAGDIVEYRPRAQAVRYVQDEPVRRVVARTAPRRSWQKTALVIGGSAGAGAGIGALAGGKKGALIGAAIGGGAGSIFEAFKRR